uniref:caveolae-associated protein 2-like n=1 Tax=Myxine glutinosa TaxID=7769 RepID=UPI00358E8C9D
MAAAQVMSSAVAVEDVTMDNTATLALIDRLLCSVEALREGQVRLQERQECTAVTLRAMSADLAHLGSGQTEGDEATAALLGKARKVSANVRDIRAKLGRQAVLLEGVQAGQARLLQLDNFRILIAKHGTELEGDDGPTPRSSIAQPSITSKSSIDAAMILHEVQDEVFLEPSHEIPLDDDEEEMLGAEGYDKELDEMLEEAGVSKKTSRLDTLKRAFSKENFEKKMSNLSHKVYLYEKDGKVKKAPEVASDGGESTVKRPQINFMVRKVRKGPGEGTAKPQSSVVVLCEDSPGIRGQDVIHADTIIQYAELDFTKPEEKQTVETPVAEMSGSGIEANSPCGGPATGMEATNAESKVPEQAEAENEDSCKSTNGFGLLNDLCPPQVDATQEVHVEG